MGSCAAAPGGHGHGKNDIGKIKTKSKVTAQVQKVESSQEQVLWCWPSINEVSTRTGTAHLDLQHAQLLELNLPAAILSCGQQNSALTA